MQTTLRINDAIYREAKATAALQGTSLTRFIEEALKRHLRFRETKSVSRPQFRLPVIHGGSFAPGIHDLDQALKLMEDNDAHKVMGRKS